MVEREREGMRVRGRDVGKWCCCLSLEPRRKKNTNIVRRYKTKEIRWRNYSSGDDEKKVHKITSIFILFDHSWGTANKSKLSTGERERREWKEKERK